MVSLSSSFLFISFFFFFLNLVSQTKSTLVEKNSTLSDKLLSLASNSSSDTVNESYNTSLIPEELPNILSSLLRTSTPPPSPMTNLHKALHEYQSHNQTEHHNLDSTKALHQSLGNMTNVDNIEISIIQENEDFSQEIVRDAVQLKNVETLNVSSLVEELCRKQCERAFQFNTEKQVVFIFLLGEFNSSTVSMDNISEQEDKMMSINKTTCHCDESVISPDKTKTTVQESSLLHPIDHEKTMFHGLDEQHHGKNQQEELEKGTIHSTKSEDSTKLAMMLSTGDHLPETLPSSVFRPIGNRISEQECNRLCLQEQECVSYRWSSLDNLCEFQQVVFIPRSCSNGPDLLRREGGCQLENTSPDKDSLEIQNSSIDMSSFINKEKNVVMRNTTLQKMLPFDSKEETDEELKTFKPGHIVFPETDPSFSLSPQTFPESIEIETPQLMEVNEEIYRSSRPTSVVVETEEMSTDQMETAVKQNEQSMNGGLLLGGSLLQKTLLGNAISKVIPGLLSSSAGNLLRGSEEIPTLMHGAANAVKTVQSVFAAGDTVMKTFPVADMVRAGQQLARNGFLNFGRPGSAIKGGVPPGVKDKAKGATGPPRGVEPPQVFCYPQGMRCCIPQGAATKYRKDPPLLNGIAAPECTAHYITNINKLCVTIMYEDNHCNQAMIVTETSTVYRNVMIIPDKAMNNAICECIVPKPQSTSSDGGIAPDFGTSSVMPSSARWQYSRNAKEKENENRQRLRETAKKLGNAAKTAFFLSDVVTKPYTDPEEPSLSQGASSFIHTLSELGESLHVDH